MADAWGVLVELLQVALLLALVPARLAWPMVTSGSGLRALVGLGIIVVVYSGLIAAVARGIAGLLAGRQRRSARQHCQ